MNRALLKLTSLTTTILLACTTPEDDPSLDVDGELQNSTNLYDSRIFQWQFYLNANPDLRANGIVDEQLAKVHWRDHGIFEGRASAPGFHAKQYLARYPDLQRAFGSRFADATEHFLLHGSAEQRQGISSCPPHYKLTGKQCTVTPGLLDMGATVTTTVQVFRKTVFSFPVPATAQAFRGLTGGIAIAARGATEKPTETLFVIGYVPSGQCLPNGTFFDDFPSLFAAMPGSVHIGNYMVKHFGDGAQWLPTEMSLPQSIPLKGCFFVIFDGGPSLGAGSPVGSLTSVSSMFAKLETTAPPAKSPYRLAADDEFCIGTANGCQRASAQSTATFASSRRIPRAGRMISAHGNETQGALTRPAGQWQARNGYYVDRGCKQFQPPATPGGAIYGPANFFAQIPSDATKLFDITDSGTGVAIGRTINQTLNVAVTTQDCLVHIVRVAGTGAVNQESQVHFMIAPN